jgi:hypothetical protein
MRKRIASFVLLLACAVAAPGCSIYYGGAKFLGLMHSPPFVVRRDAIPEDFQLSIDVHDVAEPPIDYLLVFDRSGKATADVVVRAPRRKQQSSPFEITEDQLKSLWAAVADARFDELATRYPDDGDGADKKNGVQLFYVFADKTDRRVELHFQVNADLEKIRKAAVAVVPREVMTASGAPGEPGARPKEFIVDATTHLIHLPTCPKLKDVPPANRRPFSSCYEALNFQNQPCPECKPQNTK